MIFLYIPKYVGAFQSYQIFMMSNLYCLCFLNKNSFLKCPVLPDELLMQLTTRWQQSTMYVCSLTGQNKLIHFFSFFQNLQTDADHTSRANWFSQSDEYI